jgi:hypothetical protein
MLLIKNPRHPSPRGEDAGLGINRKSYRYIQI